MIYLPIDLVDFFMVNVGKHTSPMDPMGWLLVLKQKQLTKVSCYNPLTCSTTIAFRSHTIDVWCIVGQNHAPVWMVRKYRKYY